MKTKDITTDSLAHTKWDCKYHIVFAPEYRRQALDERRKMWSVSSFLGYLKGKSSLMIFDRLAELKYKYGKRQF